MKITNKHKVARVFMEALSFDDYDRGDSKYSSSNLIAPVRQVWLERRHEDEIEIDVTDLFPRWRGKAMHAELEKFAKAESIAEERLYMEIAGVRISMKPDHYDGETQVNEDYKTTSVFSFLMGIKPEWERQLNIGAMILRHYGFPVKELVIHAICWDWNRNEARRNSDYLPSPLHSVDIPLWTQEDAIAYAEQRVRALEVAEGLPDDDLPLCTPEERWESPTQYAVMKGANKRATRVFDTQAMAEQFVEQNKGDFSIATRPGTARRCADYCEAAPFCNQFTYPL